MPTAKQPKPKPTVWAILDRERTIQLWVGREEPYIQDGFVEAPRGTKFLGQLCGSDSKAATGLELVKVGKPVAVEIGIKAREITKRVKR
jgi:hypothetical protein